MKNAIFDNPIIPLILNVNNEKTTSAKTINLDIIKKLIEYSLEGFPVKARFFLIVLEILLFEARLVLGLAERITGSERVKISVKNQENCSAFIRIVSKVNFLQTYHVLNGFHYFLILFTTFSPENFEKKTTIFEVPKFHKLSASITRQLQVQRLLT